jgi:hypothetical protein
MNVLFSFQNRNLEDCHGDFVMNFNIVATIMFPINHIQSNKIHSNQSYSGCYFQLYKWSPLSSDTSKLNNIFTLGFNLRFFGRGLGVKVVACARTMFSAYMRSNNDLEEMKIAPSSCGHRI